MKSFIKLLLREALSDKLKSKSDKGNRYFEMLRTAKFQHYDSPKGELSTFNKGEEDRKRLVSKLSDEDKKTYRAWLKTPEGKESILKFEQYCSSCNNKLNENFTIDKYGDKLKIDKSWSGFKIPISEYKTKVKDSLVDIIVRERGISEKSFSAYDKVIDEVKQLFISNVHLSNVIDEGEGFKNRPEFIAEKIYNDVYLSPNKLNETKKKSEFEKLKDIINR